MSGPALLVVSPDSLTAALLATLLDSADYVVSFPECDRPLLDEIARIRPDIVLVDADHPAARSESFYDGIRRAGAVAAIFTRQPGTDPGVGPAGRDVYHFALPTTCEELVAILRGMRDR